MQNWYSLSKTEAEIEAWEFAKKSGINLVTLCPTLVWGPLLQGTVNSSSLVLVNLLKGTYFCNIPILFHVSFFVKCCDYPFTFSVELFCCFKKFYSFINEQTENLKVTF